MTHGSVVDPSSSTWTSAACCCRSWSQWQSPKCVGPP